MILAGDVGGTKTGLGLFSHAGGRLRVVREGSFRSREFASLEAMVTAFLAEGRQKIHRCAIGVAGPVVGGRTLEVNVPWSVNARRLARHLGLDHVDLLNDLEATAWGIPQLGPRKLTSLTPGLRSRPGNAALIAAGTGLGTALLIHDGRHHRPQASEGGHQAFGPRDALEIELLQFMHRRHERVSVERLVAGPGFSAIYDFLIASGRGRKTRLMTRRLAESKDPNRVISEVGLREEDRTASGALDLFVSLYGAAAGDLALVAGATGGVYIGGGIAPKILPRLRGGRFMRSFRRKGRLTRFVERIPVRVIMEPRAALIGSAACAAGMPAPSATRQQGNR